MKYALIYGKMGKKEDELIEIFNTIEEARQWCINNSFKLKNFSPSDTIVHTYYKNMYTISDEQLLKSEFGGYLNTYYMIKEVKG